MGKATFVVLLALFAATLAKPHESVRDQNESPVEYLPSKGVQHKIPYEFDQLYNYNQVPEVNLAPYFEAQRREFPRILYPPFVSFPKELYDRAILQHKSTDDREGDVFAPLEQPASSELFDENQKQDDIPNKRNPEIIEDAHKPSYEKPSDEKIARDASEHGAAPVTNDEERGNASEGNPNEDQPKDEKDIEKPMKGRDQRKKDTPHSRPHHGSHSHSEIEDREYPGAPRPRSHEKDAKEGLFGEDSKFQPPRPSPKSAVARPRGPARKDAQPQQGNPGNPEASLVQINVNVVAQ